MTSRSGRGRWNRVVDARRQSRAALGLDQKSDDLFDAQPKKRSVAYVRLSPIPVEQRPNESIRVLTLVEAASRLGVRRVELEKMIAVGKIVSLPTGYTRTIPTREIERLTGKR